MTRMWAKRPDLGLGSPPWDSPCVLSLCGKPRLPTREGRLGRCCLRRSLWGRWKSNSAGGQALRVLISPAPGGRERLFTAGLSGPLGGPHTIPVFQADPLLPRGRLSEPNSLQSL